MLSDLLNSGLYEVEERIYTSQSNPLEKFAFDICRSLRNAQDVTRPKS